MKKAAFTTVLLTFIILASDSVLKLPALAQTPLKAAQTESALPFSPAVRTASLIFVSGHIGIDPQTGKLAGRPDIVTRGFVDTREFRNMIDESRDLLARTLDHGGVRTAEWSFKKHR